MRCAVHPARPAVGECPVCGRGRCNVDASQYGAAGCGACQVGPPTRVSARRPELVVRAALAAVAVAYVGGWAATQYVRVHLMSLLAPGLVGVVAAWAVSAASRALPRRIAYPIALAGAWLGTALGFRLVPGGQDPLQPMDTVLGPYLAAIVGIAIWPVLFGSRRQPSGAGHDEAGTAL